jgi:hypothetical protein
MCLVSVSCKSIEVVASSEVQDVQKLRSVDTVVIRDSIFVREVMRGDTVYLTRTEFRDRWRTQLLHDTIVHTDSIVRVIEHPPERYVPKFYKWSTALFFILLLLLGLGIFIKLRLKVK